MRLSATLKDQLTRAASSITLNLAEGAARPSPKERLGYYNIAFGSLREVQALIRLENLTNLHPQSEHLDACLYKLTRQ